MRELSQLIAHLEADTRRVNDQRFRALLDKSAEVLKSLRKLFERYESSDQENRAKPAAKAERSGEFDARRPATRKAKAARPKVRAGTEQSAKGKNHESPGEGQSTDAGGPAQESATLSASPEPMVQSSQPHDPDEVAARTQQQRKEARAPRMPGGPAAPKPMPPRSGKPVWSKPHSS